MLKSTFILLSLLPLSLLAAVKSPDGQLEADFTLNADGAPRYTVRKAGQLVLRESRLGLVRDDADFSKGLTLLGTSETEPVVDRYEILTAKRRLNDYRANCQTFHLATAAGKKMDVIFQVSNDGVAFRYFFPETSAEVRTLTADASSFHFPSGTKAWLQPMQAAKSGWKQTNPAYEEFYQKEIPVGTPSPLKQGWVYPALFRTGDTWLLISEGTLARTACATHLSDSSPDGDYGISFPDARETMHGQPVNPASTLPWLTPWRFIGVGSLKTITESTLGLDLADKPAGLVDPTIKPGKAAWSWPLLGDKSANYDTQKHSSITPPTWAGPTASSTPGGTYKSATKSWRSWPPTVALKMSASSFGITPTATGMARPRRPRTSSSPTRPACRNLPA